MKKLIFLAIITVVTSVAINAQIVVGGGFSFSTSGGSNTSGSNTVDKVSRSSFSFAPMGGFFLSEDFLVGAEIFFSTSKVKTPGTQERIDKTTGFGIAPFARYYAIRFDKFSIFGQASVGLGFGSEKTEVGGTSTDGPKTTSFYFSVFPGIAYDISDKIQLQASINVANFGFSSRVQKETIGTIETKDKTTNFGFGVNLDNIANTSNFSIGAIIKL